MRSLSVAGEGLADVSPLWRLRRVSEAGEAGIGCMSAIPLEIARRRLRVIGNHADADLQQALDGAEQEACRYLNREQLPTLPQDWPCSSSEEVPSSEDPVAPDVVEGVLLLVMASYNAVDPATVEGYRRAAEVKLHPYRLQLGV